MLYETSLHADNERDGAHQQPPSRSGSARDTTRTAATAAAATETANSLKETQAIGNAAIGDASLPHPGSTAANGRSGTEDEVGTFLHRRVREILRAGTGGGGQGEGRGDVDEGILGYLLRKQHAVEGCDDLNSVAVSGYGMYEELGGGDVRVPGGFSTVVDALAGKVSPVFP